MPSAVPLHRLPLVTLCPDNLRSLCRTATRAQLRVTAYVISRRTCSPPRGKLTATALRSPSLAVEDLTNPTFELNNGLTALLRHRRLGKSPTHRPSG